MDATTYEPVVFTLKDGSKETAETIGEYYQLLWDGASPNGPAPALVRPPFSPEQQAELSTTYATVVGVRGYGAVGDKTTDDTVALQAAIDAMKAHAVTDPPLSRPVVLDGQGGTYRITDSLDLTGLTLGRGWEVRNLHIVAACTDKIALDLSGSRFGHFTNVHVWGDQTTQPHTGIALSRTTTSPCDRFTFDNVTVDGYFTSSALHLNAAEEHAFNSSVFANRRVADGSGEAWAVILDGAGYKTVPSLYQTPSTTRQSFTVNKFNRCAIQKPFGISGPTMFLQDLASISFESCYLTNGSGTGIVWRLTDGFTPYRVYMDFQQETTGTDRFITFTSNAAGAREIRGLHCTFGNIYTDQDVFNVDSFVTSLALRSFKAHVYRMATGVTLANKLFNGESKVSIYGGDIIVPTAADFDTGFAALADVKVLGMDGTVATYEAAWTTYTPTWGGTGVSIGDGTLTGRYVKRGRTIHFSITLTAGSTTNFGSGAWTFSLPTAAQAAGMVFQARLQDASAAVIYPGVLDLNVTTSGIVRNLPLTAGGPYSTVNANSPFAWASGDRLSVVGTYEAAS